jgi:hypothetical protein
MRKSPIGEAHVRAEFTLNDWAFIDQLLSEFAENREESPHERMQASRLHTDLARQLGSAVMKLCHWGFMSEGG